MQESKSILTQWYSIFFFQKSLDSSTVAFLTTLEQENLSCDSNIYSDMFVLINRLKFKDIEFQF